ncbi:RNA-directed DNA polymerase [candidate division KSB1 bacterium]|nr:RNA-directed DNA polymerase [candidate division KSB1 bacterium]
MKRYGNLWEQLISFKNVFEAFTNAIKGKGTKPYVLEFIQNFEHNILTLQEALTTKSYQPGDYTTFLIYEPKKRMISAAPFVDRIVHHCLINVIGPIFEPAFIAQSYANQVNKGTHRAIRDVQAAMRLHDYVLHCDIRKYFPSIDHDILKNLIQRKIKDPDVLWLINLIIDSSNPQEPVIDYFPGDDLLTPAERRRGLPIGNLTSQFFANVYLTGFDHFVKEQLGCRFYFRYVDDMAVVDSDKNYLWDICHEMGRYLESLRVRFHPHKQHVRPVNRGVRFLGQVLYPARRMLPKRNIRRFMQQMKKFQQRYAEGTVTFEEINHSFQSWLGHAKQANTLALRRGLIKKIKFRRNS